MDRLEEKHINQNRKTKNFYYFILVLLGLVAVYLVIQTLSEIKEFQRNKLK